MTPASLSKTLKEYDVDYTKLSGVVGVDCEDDGSPAEW